MSAISMIDLFSTATNDPDPELNMVIQGIHMHMPQSICNMHVAQKRLCITSPNVRQCAEAPNAPLLPRAES